MRQLIQQIGLMQLDRVAQMADAFEVLGARPAHHAVDLVSPFQQELGQVRSILSRDAGNECSLRHATVSFT